MTSSAPPSTAAPSSAIMAPNIRRGEERRVSDWDHDRESEWKGPYFFVQGADTQFGMIESFAEGLDDRGWSKSGGWTAEIRLLSALIDKLNAMEPKPRFFIICGDLVDAYPMDEPRRTQQETDFKATLCRLDPSIPVVCVCGNHDVGDRPTASDIKRYTDEFGDDYFEFWLGGVHYLVLNSQLYKDPSLVPALAQRQEAWLEQTLNLSSSSSSSSSSNVDGESIESPSWTSNTPSSPSSSVTSHAVVDASSVTSSSCSSSSSSHPLPPPPLPRHTIAFMHIPPFLVAPEEADDVYFNLPSERRANLLRKLYDGGIRKVFCGHYHRNAGGTYKDLEVIVTSAVGAQLGSDVSGARIVQVLDSEIRHDYYAIEELPQTIDLSSLKS